MKVLLLVMAGCACLVTALGSGYGTPDYAAGKVAGHCIVLEGAGWAPSKCDAVKAVPAAPDGQGPSMAVACGAAGIDAVLATIRTQESGGRYSIGPNAGGASGAYQFIQTTWNAAAARSGRPDLVGRGPWTAAPADQDQVARQLVAEAMGGTTDITRVPVVWYIGHVPTAGEWDVVPHPEVGNRVTPRQYQTAWMGLYRRTGAPCGSPA